MIWNFFTNLILLVFFTFSALPSGINQDVNIISLLPASSESIIVADKAAVLSADGRYLLFNKNADKQQPIASITKLMTALVFVETNPDWKVTYQIKAVDSVEGGKLHLFLGDSLNLKDLFLTSLIASDNGATIALVHASGLSEKDFVLRMNEKAKNLGLSKTVFVEPIGLSEKNVSTAREVSLLARKALDNPDISAAVKLSEYRFQTLEGRDKFIESTDYLLFDSEAGDLQALGGKTGYTDKAGYCFVGRFKGPGGEELIAAVLNSPGKNERFRESKKIINWVFENYLKSRN